MWWQSWGLKTLLPVVKYAKKKLMLSTKEHASTPAIYLGHHVTFLHSGILSILGLMGSTAAWDTKGHPRNPGILSIPGLMGSTATKGNPGILSIPGLVGSTATKGHPRNLWIHGITGLRRSTAAWNTKGHPRNPSIPGLKWSWAPKDIQGYLVLQDSRGPLLPATLMDILGYFGTQWTHCCLVHPETSRESWDT